MKCDKINIKGKFQPSKILVVKVVYFAIYCTWILLTCETVCNTCALPYFTSDVYLEIFMFCTIRVFYTIRVWYVPYAYTHKVQPYEYGMDYSTIRVYGIAIVYIVASIVATMHARMVWIIPYAYIAR